MALNDHIADIAGNSPASRNRVDLLLEQWKGTPNGDELLAALHDEDIRAAVLTAAIRRETKTHSVLKDSSVAEWRRKNLAQEVNGL
jgi:hypothetical protein